ncbi:MAG: 2-C-methyl-D-erythritol 2,4-cyclodiphosphate synthase [Ruminococcus sp.]|jgi:2-C-methyl-D-erythritol 2,4-cyclodiphosphate synthase|nr:2-C-methyl-D-erythritol 2,4-cyclodiphosphate synthase [Ruminococcus sp.]
MFRIGHGYDVHRFESGRDLILCGVKIPYERGLLGHSDADAAVHALMDALLGALALGDIGKHFPDSDGNFKNADSLKLLEKVYAIVTAKGFILGNCDITIICEKPKLSPFIMTMRKNIANVLQVGIDCVSVKATTEEGLGFTGSLLGIAAHSVCLLSKQTA